MVHSNVKSSPVGANHERLREMTQQQCTASPAKGCSSSVEYAAVWTVMNSQQAAAVLGFKWLWCSVMQCGLDGVARGGGEDAQGLHLQLHPESDLHTASQ